MIANLIKKINRTVTKLFRFVFILEIEAKAHPINKQQNLIENRKVKGRKNVYVSSGPVRKRNGSLSLTIHFFLFSL